MLNTVFMAVLNMSITASIVIIVVLIARFLLKSAPKIFSYALWAVVLFKHYHNNCVYLLPQFLFFLQLRKNKHSHIRQLQRRWAL